MGCNKLLIAKLIVLSSHFLTLFAFNLDADFPSVFSSPQHNVFFGYSVDYYADSNEAWIVVGAPDADVDGKVYKCKYNSSSKECNLINISAGQSDSAKAQLGSTVVIGKNKELLACAPLFTRQKNIPGRSPEHLVQGMCCLSEDFTQQNAMSYYYLPCIRDTSTYGKDLDHCQIGNSAAFTKDNKKILLGAVGSFYGQGSILLLQDGLARNITTIPVHTPEFSSDVYTNPDDKNYLRRTYDTNYMGYSVATGLTIDNRALLVCSAPRRLGVDLLGAVIVFDESLNTTLSNFSGRQMGEYFGHGLAVVDVNGDDLDDIIVGSPLYSDFVNRRPEIGRIYVFYQLAKRIPTVDPFHRSLNFSPPTVINGKATMGRFGSTIASLGDVNDDGYTDIVVSAPYERSDSQGMANEKYGAVYVFNGGRDGLFRNPSQRIHAKNVKVFPNGPRNIRGLGYSAKGGKDVDNNGYPDVVLGAYLSDHAVLIKARPILKLKLESCKSTPRFVDLRSLHPCSDLQPCFSFSGKSLPSSIRLLYSYDIDTKKSIYEKRAFVSDSSVRDVVLSASEPQCFQDTICLKKAITDVVSPISVRIRYWISEQSQPAYPVLDLPHTKFFTTNVDIWKDCGDDNICTPQLQLSTSTNPSEVSTGDYQKVTVSVTILNLKENAYQTLLVVKYPNFTVFIGSESLVDLRPINCGNVNHSVTCELESLITAYQEPIVELEFGINVLQQDVDQLTFESWTVSENNQASLTSHANITVMYQILIQIFTASTPEFVLLQTRLNGSDTKPVSYTYEITNVGSIPISAATVYILCPEKHEDVVLFSLDQVVINGPITCFNVARFGENVDKTINELHRSNATFASAVSDLELINAVRCSSTKCLSYICNVRAMEPQADIHITLKGRIHLDYFRKNGNGFLTMTMLFQTPDDNAIQFRELSEITVYVVEPLSISTTFSEVLVILLIIAFGTLLVIVIYWILIDYGLTFDPPATDFSHILQQSLYAKDAMSM